MLAETCPSLKIITNSFWVERASRVDGLTFLGAFINEATSSKCSLSHTAATTIAKSEIRFFFYRKREELTVGRKAKIDYEIQRGSTKTEERDRERIFG